MPRLKLEDEINQIKSDIQKYLSSIFGVNTNLAPLEVQSVFQESQSKIDESLALKQTLQPHLDTYIQSLQIPAEFNNIDMDSALELVQNGIDIKAFTPILKAGISNNDIKDALSNSVPGTGSILRELGQTLSHITGPTQKSPDFVKDFLISDTAGKLGPTNISSIIDPTFTSLDTSVRGFISSPLFFTEPEDMRNILQSDVILPTDLSKGLIENSANPDVFLNEYMQTTNLTTLDPLVSTALTNGSFQKASPIMLDLVTIYAPELAPAVRLAAGSGALSGLAKDASDFITYAKLDTLTNTMRGYINQVISKVPITNEISQTVGKIIGNQVNLTNFINDASKLGVSNLNLADYGMGNITTAEAENLLSSDLDLVKLTNQINKLNFSQIPNLSISNLLNQGATQADLLNMGKMLDSGFGNKLGSITDLLGSGELGKTLSSVENSINKLKSSFLGLNVLGTSNKSDQTNVLIGEIVQIVPVGSQDPTDTLTRIGPVVNEHTSLTLEEKGDLFTKSTALVQRKFSRDFNVRGPAQKQPAQKPYDPRSPLITDGEDIGHDIPKTNQTEYPEPGSYTH